jgi:hypothetical protein
MELCWVLGALSGERGTVHGGADTHSLACVSGRWTTHHVGQSVGHATGFVGGSPLRHTLDCVNRTRWDCPKWTWSTDVQ